MPLPGHSVPLTASTVRKPNPYFRSWLLPIALTKLFTSTLATFCGRTFRPWLTEPYEVAVVKLRPACWVEAANRIEDEPGVEVRVLRRHEHVAS